MRPGLTFWLVLAAIAAVWCVAPVRAEPHGNMPSGWSLEPAADEPPATIEQEPEMRIDELKDLAADARVGLDQVVERVAIDGAYIWPADLTAIIERLVSAIEHVEPATIIVTIPAPPAPPALPPLYPLEPQHIRRREADTTRSWH